jgi:hypothetical protein
MTRKRKAVEAKSGKASKKAKKEFDDEAVKDEFEDDGNGEGTSDADTKKAGKKVDTTATSVVVKSEG